ncbi:alpha/beta hydrolase fold [Teratosphaeria destructans]|uniref:Alpha/beta hydrolase fold n=1 Tax=Teratosphaeria destructans TaxID=418781 RepID=A0A9W7W7I5_9PEZI|nr:alpha/beta hydrolase fold [Teratosphaeria destructans]
MEPNLSSQAKSADASRDDFIRPANALVINENWQGKNDPQERRRIQNRLNQRAFRQRQRAGESSKVYHRRSAPASPSPAADRSRIRSDDLRVDPPAEESKAHCSRYQVEPRATSAPAASQGSAASKDLFWDELARTINRNLVAATLTNARHLGLDLVALQSGTSTYTTRPSARQARPLPPTLVPVELQFQVAHDPIIDTLPHPRLRYNILHAITGGQLDAASLSRSIRASGALRQRGDEGSPRFGLVVWSEPELLASWELSEDFVRRFAFLLEGCEDLLVVTNAWRSRRGERPIRIPAMAVPSLPPPPPAVGDESWDRANRPESQVASETYQTSRSSKRQRSVNHVKGRPAHPAVINSILESFDTLTLPHYVQANEAYYELSSTKEKSSRPESPEEGAPVASVPNSHSGFGMEMLGTAASAGTMEDDAGSIEAALPPNIRTSRPPSGLSHYAAPLPRGVNSASASAGSLLLQDPSHNSSASSLMSGKSSGKNKHSAESWVKPHSGVYEPSTTKKGKEPEARSVSGRSTSSKSRGAERSPSQRSRRSLRRVNSQETLRPAFDDFDGPVVAASPRALSRAEQIIARTTPPLTNSRKRLYLTDTVSEEGADDESPASTSRTPETEGRADSNQYLPTDSARDTSANFATHRISPAKSPIGDSIPTRTSSLRQTSSSPAGRKREKKTKRQTFSGSQASSSKSRRSPSIPESTWADLGDDDDTVKRIKQLREQRKSRLEEHRHYPVLEDIPPLRTGNIPVSDLSMRKSEDTRRAARARPAPHRASTEPPIKAHKLLGLNEQAAHNSSLTGPVGDTAVRGAGKSPESVDLPRLRLPDKRTLANGRPTTASPPTPPLSLDYSYAQIVDALQGVDREIASRCRPHQRQRSMSSVATHRIVTDLPSTPDYSPGGRLRPRSAGRGRKKAVGQPDLTQELFERRKSRRKSTSEARRGARQPDDEDAAKRRNSIEHSVQEYLCAPRLSRKVRHPETGRLISYSEVGDPEGSAVFVCVGMGLTRYVTAFYDELATTLRLRLITVDRPGVGGSEPYPSTDRTGPLGWPDDVLTICQQLGITKFSLLAHSAGAIYALATALILPHLVNGRVHLLAPWIPPSQLETVPAMASAPPAGVPRSQRLLRVLPTSFFKAANSSFMTATSASLKPVNKKQLNNAVRERDRSHEHSPSPSGARRSSTSANPPEFIRRESIMLMDQLMPTTNPVENFPVPVQEETEEEMADLRRNSLALSATAGPLDPGLVFANDALNAAEHAEKERQTEYTKRLTQLTWELATRDSNPATDLLVCLERHRDVGFQYTDVVREIVITHGSEDKRIPVANVKWLADQINTRAFTGMAHPDKPYGRAQSRDGWADQRYSRGGCEVRVLEGEAHGLMASAPIMSDVLTEIAGYWNGGLSKGLAL